METITKEKTMSEMFFDLYDLHTKLFLNVIVGIKDEDRHNRLGTKANHIGWLAGSMVYNRFATAKVLGLETEPEYGDLFKDDWSIRDNAEYPTMEQYRKDWERITPKLKKVFENIQPEKLNGPDPFEMPGEDFTLYDTLKFFAHRESYCIGQIGLFRRLLGYEAMKYDIAD